MRFKFTNPFAEFPREVGVIVFASFFVAVGFGIIAPTIPLFARSFGVNHAQVGAIVSTFAFARFASGLVSGKLVDKFGERWVYSVGIGFVAITSFAAGLAQNYEQLLVFRAVGGVGSSMFSVAAGVPQEESWRCAFGLMVTLVWLYLEVLRLISILRSND